jgi:hypothetical protein
MGGVSRKHKTFKKMVKERQDIFGALTPGQRRSELGIKHRPSELTSIYGMRTQGAGQGVTIREGSAKQGKSHVAGFATSRPMKAKIEAHEAHHADPNRPHVGSLGYKRAMEIYGEENVKRGTNAQAFQRRADMIGQQLSGAYKMSGKKAERSVDAYRNLQNSMRAKGVKPRKAVQKSFIMWDGITSVISKMNPDPADVHIVGSSGKKRGIIRKVPAPTRGM